MSVNLDQLVDTALSNAADLIIEVLAPSPYKRRLVFRDKSFLDLYLSFTQKNIYAFHYERRHLDSTIYRVDNYPHHKALKLKTQPHHFHVKQEAVIKVSPFGTKTEVVLVNFLLYIRTNVLSK